MKTISILLLGLMFVSANAQQQKPQPQLLKGPTNWSFERFSLPPVFAPSFAFKGAEELRFSPGMFNKDSASYFSYAFAAEVDSVSNISQADVQKYLTDYFFGLCTTTASQRKLKIDSTQINVVLERKRTSPGNDTIYNATLHIFGVFADGAPVKLNMEIKVLNDAANAKTYLLAIASPKDKTDIIWKQLYEIQKAFKKP
jgi:hypothetical protein